MTSVIDLWRDEPLRFDPERLADMYIELGEAQAQDAVERMLHDLDFTLRRIKGLRRAERYGCLSRSCERISDIATELGLSSLARVTRDVAITAACGDETALSATMSRLERVANRSLKIVSGLHDMSG
ncbi:hypothetical protein [Actibacterium ureilyticum]|uniref:hypothetical protein n=1 Tax=Actibacterium ureilyticum TaxID=1590614 RepID=UPI000BAB0BC9|nr:hypothetical protein [Actibacterium ureilyticum]